ncbi:arginyl-tRNA synthetase [Candidatus Scalindua japonica]|uniref:Arginyl-tRNA synthetase n=2 Tax=Candidatus Scalindua japonica TaxID=1284222 RepID=A0A286TY59_9BACT|nr:arginyl-tRNA synthetase [Candidatus Scalindua japonica]
MATDVSTRSFSVVWMADGPFIPQLEVFSDPDGLNPISVSVTNVSQNYPPAEDLGVLKVTVTGLTSGTTYYYRTTTTSKGGGNDRVYPVTTPLPSVTTEILVKRTITSGEDEVPFTNDLLTIDVFQEDGVTIADGALIVLDIAGADYPISAFVGMGTLSPATILDLNNVFDKNAHESMDLKGNESTALRLIGGGPWVIHIFPLISLLKVVKRK